MQDPLLDCEEDIREYLAEHTTTQCPPLLAQAMEYAVFPGGARVRPQLCMAVALANNSSDRPLAAAAATKYNNSGGPGCALWPAPRSDRTTPRRASVAPL